MDPSLTPSEVGPHELFVRALKTQGLNVKSVSADGRYVVRIGEVDCTISLDNVSREFKRHQDPSAVDRFVKTLLDSYGPAPSWDEAKALLRLSAEPTDIEGLKDTVHDIMTDEIARVLVCVSKDERRITWVDSKQLSTWGVSREDAITLASDNLSMLLEQAKLTVENVEGHKLAYFDTPSVFKASLIFASGLKRKVEAVLGWPIYALAPCRTFLYMLPLADRDFLPRLGGVIVEEHSKSGYPISTDVLQIDDGGITAIAGFQRRKG